MLSYRGRCWLSCMGCDGWEDCEYAAGDFGDDRVGGGDGGCEYPSIIVMRPVVMMVGDDDDNDDDEEEEGKEEWEDSDKCSRYSVGVDDEG